MSEINNKKINKNILIGLIIFVVLVVLIIVGYEVIFPNTEYVESNTFLLTYELDGGVVENPREYCGDNTITLNNPTKKGYTFIGWTGTDLDGLTMNVTISAGSYGDRKYKTNWSPNQYTLTLNANGGNVNQTKLVSDYDSSYILPIPTRDYYTFAGWYNENTQYTDGTWIKAADITLSAKWTPISYSIVYNLNGGINSNQNPVSFDIETSTITLSEPTKYGYKFLGWYSDYKTIKNKLLKRHFNAILS